MIRRHLGWAFGLVGITLGLCACAENKVGPERAATAKGEGKMKIEKESYGKTPDGQAADIYTLTNANGAKARITNYGAIVVELWVPDRDGKLGDVVLGYDKLADYIKDTPYFGAIVGRYGNRIAHGKFTLEGRPYTLATNWKMHHLHGGKKGFDKVVWQAEPVQTADAVALKLTYLSKDGQEGYPGNLNVTVTYRLTNDNALKIEYEATTDKATPVNLTHHGYWNLAGAGTRDILDHALTINADKFTPTNDTLIPTGELPSVAGTPFDFRKSVRIGEHINDDDQQLKYGGGYDHNWVLNRTLTGDLELAARVCEPTTGRVMEVLTTEPGLQFYSGNFLDGSNVGKGGKPYQHRYGFCLEAQHYPDSPNQPQFPSTILRPGQVYHQTTVYKFSVK